MAHSKGRKRLLSSVLGLSGILLSFLPGAEAISLLTEILAGSIGVVGLGHAARAKTITKKKLTSLAALSTALLAAAPFLPVLTPFIPILEGIVAVLATLGIGNEVKDKVKK